jgi:Protein of unknown function (DUF2905)
VDLQAIGRGMLIIGIVIAILGGLLIVFGQSSVLSRLGNLPGDLRVEGQGFTCVVPIVSMILVSIVLTVILNIVIRLINRP